MAARVVLISGDLMFTSKVTGTARALGRSAQVCLDAQKAAELAGTDTHWVLVDLGGRITPSEMAALRQDLPASTRLLAFGSHVDVERLGAARAAGCDPVLARSEFTARLAELLATAPPDET